MRVLDYKYYDGDVTVIYTSNNYDNYGGSNFSLYEDERELDTQILQNYEELPGTPGRLEPFQPVYMELPRREEATLEYFEAGPKIRRLWHIVKGWFSFKSCRKGRS